MLLRKKNYIFIASGKPSTCSSGSRFVLMNYMLSVGSGFVLINFILSNLSIFVLSFFEVPRGILKKLHYFKTRFF
jgi:hypothetical protein